ncbi:MAG TPA: hypothetical protein VLE03_01310 [Nitrospiraceae bacterium]|nr:hypothetical protein [Nitrospiraceae bacterium]
MGRSVQHFLIGLLFCSLPACVSARHVPQPILQRGDAVALAGDPLVLQDLTACQTQVRDGAQMTMQPRWLPPLGSTDHGVVLGTADGPHPVWPSREAYRDAIERCLTARGYRIRGWQ